MNRSPIYDELAAEMRGSVPLCRVCGNADVINSPTNLRAPDGSVTDGGCFRCYERGLLEPNWPEAWDNAHCFDCGEFVAVTFSVMTDEVPGRVAVTVCADHAAERAGKHTVWDTGHIDNIAVVDELPPATEVFPFPTLGELFALRNRYVDAGEWPPNPAPTVIFDQLSAEMAPAC